MGLVRFRIREFADEKGWTLKDVADRSEVPLRFMVNQLENVSDIKCGSIGIHITHSQSKAVPSPYN